MSNRRRVSTWPSYLLQRIPPDLIAAIREEAQGRDDSMTDVIRRILCARYRLNCPPRSWRYEPTRNQKISAALHIRLQPKLYRALVRESGLTGWPIRDIIMSELEAHYERKAA